MFLFLVLIFYVASNAIFEKTYHFVVVDELVDPAELEDNERPDNLHRGLRLESRIVVLGVARVKQLIMKGFMSTEVLFSYITVDIEYKLDR